VSVGGPPPRRRRPGVRGRPACYGPNATAPATLLASTDVIGSERTAELMSALLGVSASTGFVSSCQVRLDDALDTEDDRVRVAALLR
jgi:hypothetical protein